MRIAVVADRNRSYGRALCEGVASYALERTDWTLGLLDSDRPVGLKGYDAVVARIVSSEMLASLRRTNLPIVDVYCALPRGEGSGLMSRQKHIPWHILRNKGGGKTGERLV